MQTNNQFEVIKVENRKMIKISKKHLKNLKNENQEENENKDQERKMKIRKKWGQMIKKSGGTKRKSGEKWKSWGNEDK